MPELRYYQNDLFGSNDLMDIGTSTGIMYGLNGNFVNPPRIKFFQVDSTYDFPPAFEEFFTPKMKLLLYNSRSGRNDLGLESYYYWLCNGVIEPGVTLLKKIKVYSGFGAETNTITDVSYAGGSGFRNNAEKGTQKYLYFETALDIQIIPIRLGNQMNKYLTLSYDRYWGEGILFNEIKLKGLYDYTLKSKSIYSVGAEYGYVWDRPPFYHELPVMSAMFKGLGSYYSRNRFAVSNEYRISLYRDFIYLGLFFDAAVFEGSGYDISGTYFGIVGGPTMRFLILDQFEFYMHYGQDLRIPGDESGVNISFNLEKKW